MAIKDLDTQHGYEVLVQTTLELHKTYDGRDGRFPEQLNCLMKQM